MTIRSIGRNARHAARRRRRRRDVARACDALERRLLLAATPFARLAARGTLIIDGDDNANVVLIHQTSTQVIVTRDGIDLSFGSATVKRMIVDGHGGADLVRNDTALRSEMIGGAGDDTLIGGSGNDTFIGGAARRRGRLSRASPRTNVRHRRDDRWDRDCHKPARLRPCRTRVGRAGGPTGSNPWLGETGCVQRRGRLDHTTWSRRQ
jgi:hypothetical protein